MPLVTVVIRRNHREVTDPHEAAEIAFVFNPPNPRLVIVAPTYGVYRINLDRNMLHEFNENLGWLKIGNYKIVKVNLATYKDLERR